MRYFEKLFRFSLKDSRRLSKYTFLYAHNEVHIHMVQVSFLGEFIDYNNTHHINRKEYRAILQKSNI